MSNATPYSLSNDELMKARQEYKECREDALNLANDLLVLMDNAIFDNLAICEAAGVDDACARLMTSPKQWVEAARRVHQDLEVRWLDYADAA